jgi:hypothetical protein
VTTGLVRSLLLVAQEKFKGLSKQHIAYSSYLAGQAELIVAFLPVRPDELDEWHELVHDVITSNDPEEVTAFVDIVRQRLRT